jgi:hypothetical protein
MPHKKKLTKAFEKHLRRHHRLGHTDTEIVRTWHEETGVSINRRTVCEFRARLNLPSNACSPWRRDQVRQRTSLQLLQMGLPSIGYLRVLAFRAFARRNGWPEDLRPRAVQILNLLYEQGPQTRRQISDAIGMPWKGSRKSLHSNDPEGSYLAHLIKRGFVVQLPRLVKGKGQGKSVHLYSIAPNIKRMA